MPLMNQTRKPKPMRSMLAGAAGGLLGAWIMTEIHEIWNPQQQAAKPERMPGRLYHRSHDRKQQQNGQTAHAQQSETAGAENQAEHKEDATMKAADQIAQAATGHSLTPSEKKKAAPVVHYAFGALAGGIYGLVSEYLPSARRGFGSLFGATLFVIADEIAVPALGLAEAPTKTPLAKHLFGLASHVVYGLTTETVRKTVGRAA
jgi:putative membrane protein